MDIQHTLRQVPLFSALSDEALSQLARKATIKTAKKNTIVVSRGDTSAQFYVLLTGAARIYIDNENGREAVLNTLGAGDYFGELALLGGIPRSANVLITRQSRLLLLHSQAFQECVLANPESSMAIIRSLARRVAELSEEVGSLALLDVYGRLVRLIEKESFERDGQQIMNRLTHQDLASRIGASREMVTRIMQDLSKGDYLQIRDKEIVVHRPLPQGW